MSATAPQVSTDELLSNLTSSRDGLTGDEATQRLRAQGPNTIATVRPKSVLLALLAELTHFFALLLWIAAALAFVADRVAPGQAMGTLGFAIIGVIIVNGAFSFWQEHRAERAVSALQRLLPEDVRVLRDGKTLLLRASVLVPGDVIWLSEGDQVPADCRLLEAIGLRVNSATLTGESVATGRNTEASTAVDPLRSRNVVLAGTSVVSGEARALVFATGGHTEFGRIASLTQAAVPTLSPLQREIRRLSRLIAALSVGIGAIFFLIGTTIGVPLWANALFAIGIIVANVPEGLLPTVTLSLALATQRMARRNALIRHLPSVEALGSATVICTDKTGTLTMGNMAARHLYLGSAWLELAALEAAPERFPEHRLVLAAALNCQSVHEVERDGHGERLGDPMETELMDLARRVAPDLELLPRVDEVPFDTDRKRQSTLHQSPVGLVLFTKGALETVLPLCTATLRGHDEVAFGPDAEREVLAAQDRMAEAGLRVLAFAYRRAVPGEAHDGLEHGLVLAGLVGLEDPPRPEVPAAVDKCHQAGIRLIMITGDHPRTAAAVAREVGMTRGGPPRIVTGEQLRQFSAAELTLAVQAPAVVFARVGADQKMQIVESLKAAGEIVAATGDGVNDAPALRCADIGIAMGRSGTDVARAAADMVLLDDNFASIVSAVEEGRAVYDNIRKFLTYILTSNVPELVPYLAFVLLRIPLALSIIQILAIDLGTDMLPALALGAEPPEDGIMQRPPRPRRQRMLDWPLLARSYLFLGLLEAAASMAVFLYVLHAAGWHFGATVAALPYRRATTAALTAVVLTQVVNVFVCRSPHASVFASSPAGNRLILGGIAAELALILVIDYTAIGHRLFGTADISGFIWLLIVPMMLVMLALEEARKWLARRRR